MKKIYLIIALTALVLAGCSTNSEVDSTAESFKLGFIPTEQASTLTPKAEALADFLSQEMNLTVEVFVPDSYEALIEGLRFDNLDAAFMDSSPAWIANQKAGAEVVLAELENGEPYYYADIYALEDSQINSLADIPGKRIAFTSMTGSSGFIFPIGEMINKGYIRPKNSDFASLELALQDTFESYTVSGGYNQSIQLLLENKVDVIGSSHKSIEALSPEEQAKIKLVQRIGKSPSHPVVVNKNLNEQLKNKFIASMLKLNEPENIAILENIYGVSGLVETDTKTHLEDLGKRVQAVTGITESILNKKN
jgi:phosphonate transport system substrate-binding protein